MNEEQNNPGADSEDTTNTSGSSASGNSQESASGGDDANPKDGYYAVDHAKKDVISTIGDGEMHDEGLLGVAENTSDFQSSTEEMTDEQDEAEARDSER